MYHPPPMARALLVLALTAAALRCAAPAPPPAPAPEPAPVAEAKPAEERVVGAVRVTATALNVRTAASADADVVAQVKRGQALDVLANGNDWVKVRLAGGEVGWVSARYVSGGVAEKKRKVGCESDYAFTETPTLAFSDSGAHGLVVVEASVSAKGNVTSTKVVSNATGDESLAFLAEKEIKGAKFAPPMRNCVARAFIFTYRRTF